MSDTKMTVFGGNVPMKSSAELAKSLSNVAARDPRGGGADGASYLNFSGKRGMFTSGPDSTVIDADRMFLPNIQAFETGYVCWKGGKPVATMLANMGEVPPSPDFNQFAPFGDGEGWMEAMTMMLKDVDDGSQHYLKINSVSGVSAIANFAGLIRDRALSGDPCWPLITLGTEEFTARGYKNFKPTFNIEGWLDDERVGLLFGDGDHSIDELIEMSGTAGVSPTEGEDEVAEAEPVEDEKPRRRRSRSRAL